MTKLVTSLLVVFALFCEPASSLAFNHHVRVTAQTNVAPPSGWSNNYSCKYAGTSTGTAARTNWGQPADWCVDLSANAITFSFWFRSNTGSGQDASGSLLTSAETAGTNVHFRTNTTGSAVDTIFAGGNFVGTCSASISANTWYLATFAFDGAGGLQVYVGNTSSACASYVSVGTQTCTRDFLFNTLRSTSNADIAFGAWGTPHLDEFTVWDVAFSGTDHTARIDGSNHAVDPTTHTHAANLLNYYRCGDDVADSTTTLYDQVGAVNGTHSGTDGVTYVTDVP